MRYYRIETPIIPKGATEPVLEVQFIGVEDGAPAPEGGTLATEEEARSFVLNLDAARANKWAEVKARRDELETGVAPTPVGPVQIDERSKAKIHALATMAMLAQQAGAPFAEPFTMADNTVRVLSASDAITMALAAGRFVADVHAVARELRGQIATADETLEAIAVIDVEAAPWPAAGDSGGD